MDQLRAALKGQYRASLAMLKGAIEACPDDLWDAGVPPRQFWRLAYHTLFYAHLYMEATVDDFQPWSKHRDEVESDGDRESLDALAYTKEEILEYFEFVWRRVDHQVDVIDLTAQNCGIPWYHMPKLDHQIVNIRHIQEHAGQLRDRLLEAGIDQKWVAQA